MTRSPRIRDLVWPTAALALMVAGLAPARAAAEPLPAPAIGLLGAGSCATASCHGGPQAGNHDVQTFAATLWATRDPHARAYETLHEPRSRRMAALLGIGEAHRARQCLVCHAAQAESAAPLPPDVLADGVACGSCHGDAARWLAVHTLPEWKQLDDAARAELGHRDLNDVGARARTCIPCHVGDASREVDHDLVAAGHPRLAFEFAAYQRLWPRHWSPAGKAESRADFAQRSWAAGQAEMLAAVARLLARRVEQAAEPGGPDGATDLATAEAKVHWPEFAEFDCYSCHRPLSPERVAAGGAGDFRNPFPGAPSWQPWAVSAAQLLSTTLPDAAAARVGPAAAELRAAFLPRWSAGDPDQIARIRALAAALEQSAEEAARAIEVRRTVELDASPERLDALVAAERAEWRFWDAAVQTFLLMKAVTPPAADSRAALDEIRASLLFPPGVGGPDRFDPAAFERARAAVPYRRPSGR